MEALQQIVAQIGLDSTFYVIFALLVVLHLFLSAVYLKPYEKLILQRKRRTEGASKEAEKLVAEADAAMITYKQRVRENHEQVRAVMKEAEDFARNEEIRILGEASSKSKALIQGAQRSLEGERKQVLESVAGDVSDIATGIATKVLGRTVTARS